VRTSSLKESERAAVRRLKEELRRHQTSVDKSFVATGSKNQQTEERKPLAEVQVFKYN